MQKEVVEIEMFHSKSLMKELDNDSHLPLYHVHPASMPVCTMQKEVVEIEKVHAEVLEERDSTIHDMEKKVKTSQQFLEQKDSMDSALQQLQHTLEHERKKHQQDIGCDSCHM